MFSSATLLRPLRNAAAGLLSLLAIILVVSSSFAKEPTAGPAIWKVEGGTAEIYLFGTFHLLPPDLEWQNETNTQAFAGSSTLVTEADTSDNEAMAQLILDYAFNPPGKTLRSYFTEAQADEIYVTLKQLGMSLDISSAYRPWFVSLQASMAAIMSMGFDPMSGVEQVLLAQANEAGMALAYLESGEEGIIALADHPDDLQVEMLLATVEELGQMDQIMAEMINAWASGDIDKVSRLMNAGMAETPELIEALLYKRNRTWVPRIEKLAKTEGKYFIAVGAAHLAGDQSVIELLESRGYEVHRQ